MDIRDKLRIQIVQILIMLLISGILNEYTHISRISIGLSVLVTGIVFALINYYIFGRK